MKYENKDKAYNELMIFIYNGLFVTVPAIFYNFYTVPII